MAGEIVYFETHHTLKRGEHYCDQMRSQARAGITKARGILKPWACSEANSVFDGDPQPQLDDEWLERMYRELSLDV
jgi:hypothetical protein